MPASCWFDYFFLVQKYFKYVITLISIKYLVAIVFLVFSKNENYEAKMSDINYKAKINHYILLFDEYPSTFVINNFLSHKETFIDNLVNNKGFITIKSVRSNYLNTEMSIPSILYAKTSNSFKVRDALNSFKENVFTKQNRFLGYSFFDPNNCKDAINNSNFVHSFNSLTTRYLFPLLLRLVNHKGHGVFYNVQEYHNNALKLLESASKYKGEKKQVVFIHFFTPHDQLFSNRKNILGRIDEANKYISKALAMISKNDPNSAIILMSDHGYRANEVPNDYKYNGLLLYKNVDLDSAAIKKYGIVSMFNKN